MSEKKAVQLICASCGAINRIPTDRLNDKPVCGKCKDALISGKPYIASDANFNRLISKTELPVVVDFWAPWCGPCVQFAPTFEQVASELSSQAVFAKVDTEANPAVGSQFGIRSIPTLMIFHEGKELTRLSGALPKLQFEQWIKQHCPRL